MLNLPTLDRFIEVQVTSGIEETDKTWPQISVFTFLLKGGNNKSKASPLSRMVEFEAARVSD